MSFDDEAMTYLVEFDYEKRCDGPYSLSDWDKAPLKSGVYEIGLGSTRATFTPKYLGKAVRQTLKRRLRQHFSASTNKLVREHKTHCYFTFCVVPESPYQAAAINKIEGLYLIAYDDKYTWNKRQEWTQHWAGEMPDDA